MTNDGKKKKVLCPIEREGKTYWRLLGSAFINKDNSINIYLDGLPWNGRLQVRDWDDRTGTADAAASYGGLRPIAGGAPAAARSEELPF